MKKILLFASALAGLFFAASCQQENLEPVQQGNTVTYTVQLPDAIGTKAIGTNVSSVTELIYEVYRIDENGDETRLYQMTEEMTGGSATVELELVNNQDFRVLFWAQVPETGIYNTDNLKAVELLTTLNANAENYAAFANQDVITYGENLLGRTIDLVRPVAQLNIATSAESLKLGEDDNGENAQTTVEFQTTGVVVEGLSTVYNVAEGAGVAANDGATFTYEAKPVALSENTIKVNNVDYTYVSMNYVGFASKTGDNVKVSYTINTTNVGTITNTVENVPVKANYRTNIIGNLITSTSDYTVTLDNEWPAEEINVEVVSVSTAAGLQEAIDDIPAGTEGNIKLEGNIDLGALVGMISTKAGENPYGLLIPAGKTIILDLNGCTLTGVDETEISFGLITNKGNLTIVNSAEGKTGKINLNATKNDPSFSRYSSVISTQPGSTLTVGAGVEIEHFGGTSMSYGIDVLTNGKGTSAVAVIDGATVKSTYRAIRQFLNGTEANNSLTVKSGSVIESTNGNKSIWMQDPSTKSNNGSLVVEEGAELYGNVYLSVTAGSTAWPISASVAESALKNNSEVQMSDTKLEGYNVVLNDGVYEFEQSWAVDGNEYTIYSAAGLFWFAEQINSIKPYEASVYDNAIFKLANDIDLNNAEWTPIGDWASQRTEFHGIFDGQGHTISNIKVSKPCERGEKQEDSSYGLFGNVAGGTIKDVNVSNISVSGVTKFAAALVGRLNGNVENCHVANASIVCTSWQVGGLVAQYNGGKISGCSVSNSTISSGIGAVGAIAGYALYDTERTIENCSVNNCTLIQTKPYGPGYDEMFGTILGGINVSGTVININGCAANNNIIRGESSNQIVGYIQPGAKVYIDESLYVCAETTEQLESALKAGANVSLVNNVTLTNAIAISNANFILNGNGYTITQSDDCTNTYALFDITGGKAEINNVIFDGVKDGAVVRTVGVEFTADNVTAKNGVHTQQQGLFRLMGKSTITNCSFEDNNCNMVITLNYDGANSDPQLVENCVFENNTCNATAVLYYVKGDGATINSNKFIGNTVNCNNNGATVYMGFTENNVVTNNLFQNNSVNEAGESSRVGGAIFFGYKTVFTGNAFIGNEVTGANAKGNDVCVSTYYTDIDLSGNYWGGNEPVEDVNYFVQHKTSGYKVIVNNFLTENPIK